MFHTLLQSCSILSTQDLSSARFRWFWHSAVVGILNMYAKCLMHFYNRVAFWVHKIWAVVSSDDSDTCPSSRRHSQHVHKMFHALGLWKVRHKGAAFWRCTHTVSDTSVDFLHCGRDMHTKAFIRVAARGEIFCTTSNIIYQNHALLVCSKCQMREFRFVPFFIIFIIYGMVRKNHSGYIDTLCLKLLMQFVLRNSSGFVSWIVCSFASSLCSQLLHCLKIWSMVITPIFKTFF